MSNEANCGGCIHVVASSFVPFDLTFNGEDIRFEDPDRVAQFFEDETGLLACIEEKDGTIALEISGTEKCYLFTEHDVFLDAIARAGFEGLITIEWYETNEKSFLTLARGRFFRSGEIEGLTTQLTPSFGDEPTPEQKAVEVHIDEIKARVGTWQPSDFDPKKAMEDFASFLASLQVSTAEKKSEVFA